MNTKITLITLVTGIFVFTSCDNGKTTTGELDKTDTTTMSSVKNDTMDKKMNMDNMKTEDNGLMSAMNKMMDKMNSIKMTGDFDMNFASMMIQHHQGAIDMAKFEVKKGTDAKIKDMAQNILTKQTEEIGKLQEIIKNYKPSGMDMGKHDELNKEMGAMKANMSGMQISGNTDKDFAMMMIPHHEGAIKMFKDELSHGMNTQLKQMAQKGIVDQTKEISEFKSWMSANK